VVVVNIVAEIVVLYPSRLEDPDETLKLKTLKLLVTMTKANNVQVGFSGSR
jgi:hypothetical protein